MLDYFQIGDIVTLKVSNYEKYGYYKDSQYRVLLLTKDGIDIIDIEGQYTKWITVQLVDLEIHCYKDEVISTNPNIGYRHNEGKLRWRNAPLFFIKPIAEVGQYGEKKYETHNYLKGLPVSDTLESLTRHLDDFTDHRVSDFDKETKLNHIKHVAWNALQIAYTLETFPELDDRYKGDKND